MTQFITCRFRPEDSRTYTYANNGAPVLPGDTVKVPDNRDPTAWKRVTVVDVDVPEPAFACKAILGLYTGADADAAITRSFESASDSQ